jgi:hypothetical protein
MRSTCHLSLNPLHGAGPDTVMRSDFEHSIVALRERGFDLSFNRRVNVRTPKPFAFLASALQSRMDASDDHGPLKLGKDAKHLKHRFARGRARIKPLLVQIQVNAGTVYLAKEAHKVLKGTPKSINGPRGDHINFTPRCGLQHLVECRPLIATLSTADASIRKFLHYVPSVTLSGLHKLATLVLNTLSVCADAQIDRHTLGFSHCSTPVYTLPTRIFAYYYAEINSILHRRIAYAKRQAFCGYSNCIFMGDFCIAIGSALACVASAIIRRVIRACAATLQRVSRARAPHPPRAEQPSATSRVFVCDGRMCIENKLSAKDPAGVPVPRRLIAHAPVWVLELARGAKQKLAFTIARGRDTV